MFRIRGPEQIYAFDIAAERILKGWNAKGQPIQMQNNIVEEPKPCKETNNIQVRVAGESSFAGLLEDAYSLTV